MRQVGVVEDCGANSRVGSACTEGELLLLSSHEYGLQNLRKDRHGINLIKRDQIPQKRNASKATIPTPAKIPKLRNQIPTLDRKGRCWTASYGRSTLLMRESPL